MPKSKHRPNAPRVKGNARTASSSQVSQHKNLTFETLAPKTGFSDITSGIFYLSDPSVDSELRVILRKIQKKDPLTKQKALQELLSLEEAQKLQSILPYFPRLYRSLTIDTDRKVRQLSHSCWQVIAESSGKNVTPYLSEIAPYWVLGMCDFYAPASSSAVAAMNNIFEESVKRKSFFKHMAVSILEQLYSHMLLRETKESITSLVGIPTEWSAEGENTQQHIDNFFHSVQASIIKAMKLVFNMVEENHPGVHDWVNTTLFSQTSPFWKFGKGNTEDLLRSQFLACLKSSLPFMHGIADYKKHFTKFVMSQVNTSSALILPQILPLTAELVNLYTETELQKSFIPGLKSLISNGCHGFIKYFKLEKYPTFVQTSLVEALCSGIRVPNVVYARADLHKYLDFMISLEVSVDKISEFLYSNKNLSVATLKKPSCFIDKINVPGEENMETYCKLLAANDIVPKDTDLMLKVIEIKSNLVKDVDLKDLNLADNKEKLVSLLSKAGDVDKLVEIVEELDDEDFLKALHNLTSDEAARKLWLSRQNYSILTPNLYQRVLSNNELLSCFLNTDLELSKRLAAAELIDFNSEILASNSKNIAEAIPELIYNSNTELLTHFAYKLPSKIFSDSKLDWRHEKAQSFLKSNVDLMATILKDQELDLFWLKTIYDDGTKCLIDVSGNLKYLEALVEFTRCPFPTQPHAWLPQLCNKGKTVVTWDVPRFDFDAKLLVDKLFESEKFDDVFYLLKDIETNINSSEYFESKPIDFFISLDGLKFIEFCSKSKKLELLSNINSQTLEPEKSATVLLALTEIMEDLSDVNLAVELLTSTVSRLHELSSEEVWYEMYLFEDRVLTENTTNVIYFNTALVKLFTIAIEKFHEKIEDKIWDWIQCSLLSWMENHSNENLQSSVEFKTLSETLVDLTKVMDEFLLSREAVSDPSLPVNLCSDWKGFFRKSIY